MRARQWRDGSQSAVLLAQFFNWTELKCTQWAGFDTYGLFPLGDARITTIALPSCALFQHCTVARRTDKPCGSSGSRTNIFIDHHKAIFSFVHCAAGADFGTRRIIAVVARN